MDETFDFVVVGSGAGAMAAALLMRSLGKSVVVLEKTELFGGTTSTSGGVMWIPNSSVLAKAGVADSPAKALEYLDALAEDEADAPGATRERRIAYLAEAPKMLDFLASKGVRFRGIPSWPDYYDRPGALQTSRAVGSALFDANKLGAWKTKLRPNFLPVPATIDEALHLPWIKKTSAAKKVMAKVAFRVLASKVLKTQYVTAGAALQGQLLHAGLEAGVDVRLDTPVKSLLVEHDRVVGVAIEAAGEPKRINGRLGVLIAAGGFAHNQEMRDKYIPGTSVAWSNAAAGDTGDLIQEAIRLGGVVGQMHELVGGPIAIPPGAGAIKPGVQPDLAKPHTILVDQTGRRYMSEAQSYVELTRGMIQRQKIAASIPSWMILDSRLFAEYMFVGTMPGSKKPQAWFDAGFLRQGETLEALAQACSLDPATLRATVERFNGFARTGRDEDFGRGDWVYHQWLGDPTRSGAARTLGTIEEGPFYAVQIYPGDVSTFGGLVTDVHARVLKEDGAPIPGLYATGTSTASVMGGNSPGAGASVGPGNTFGYIAAKHAAHAGNSA